MFSVPPGPTPSDHLPAQAGPSRPLLHPSLSAFSHPQPIPLPHHRPLPIPSSHLPASSTNIFHPIPSSPCPPHTPTHKPSSLSHKGLALAGALSSSRPHLPSSASRKHSSSTAIKGLGGLGSTKRQNVQLSLEVKVERAKGFHAFFVPLARGLPPAPPSSPVHGGPGPVVGSGDGSGRTGSEFGSGNAIGGAVECVGPAMAGGGRGSGEYPATEWGHSGIKDGEEWVESASFRGEGMEIDAM